MCVKIEINEEENIISIKLSKEEFDKLFKKDQYEIVENVKITNYINQFVEFYCFEKEE